jgi:undecaprenyl phosphate N,N'-diacetylbacillosamine 1-phosphate transferase
MYRVFGKRCIDILSSFLALLIFSPILIGIIVLLYVAQKGNVFFFQIRPGVLGKPFKIYKFKTMTDEKDALGNLLHDEKRLTPIGRFVRKYSLDEILQLINVLKGEMSLVGPRPLLMDYLTHYSKEQARRMEVRQGIAGLAQVKGRNGLSWEKRFKYDLFYVKNLSFSLDMWILLQAIKNVLFPQGINFIESAEVSKFQGTFRKYQAIVFDKRSDATATNSDVSSENFERIHRKSA